MIIYYQYHAISKDIAEGLLTKNQYAVLTVLHERLNDEWNCTILDNALCCITTKRTYNPDYTDTTKNIQLHFHKGKELALMNITYLKEHAEHETVRTLFYDIVVPSPNKLIKLINYYRWH